MPMFCFHCRDGENGAALRKIHRDAHLAHVANNQQDYAMAGPLERGGQVVGSLLILNGEDEADARAKFERDPYFAAGVWQAIRVDAFNLVVSSLDQRILNA
ncbi:MAG: YciI family protein [Erythrobacter sp.]